jgi:hypothetical protein
VSSAVFDHLIVAAANLKQGQDFIEERLGVRPPEGGRHTTMGTHNALVRLDPGTFLEVIAIDPHGARPARMRWMGLDTPALQSTLRVQPRLVHWVARTRDLDAVKRAIAPELGPVHRLARGDFNWRMTIRDDGMPPGEGLVPSLIEWSDERHPSQLMPDAGLRLVSIAGAHPEPDRIRASLTRVGVSDTLKVTYDAAPRLAAMVRTPRGTVTL